MPKVNTTPENLRVYEFHGLDFNYKSGDKNARATCPFCGREDKFNVLLDRGTFRCVVCGHGNEKGGGNPQSFIRLLYDLGLENTSQEDYKSLANERRLLDYKTLVSWSVIKSPITDEWLVGGYGVDGKLNQLYRYVKIEGKRRLLPTPTLNHQLFGMPNFNAKADIVNITEGPWDGGALWELLGLSKVGESGQIVKTESVKKSLLVEHSVVAIPGCGSFSENWLSLFKKKIVNLWLDSDHPKKQCKKCKKSRSIYVPLCECGESSVLEKLIEPAGLQGTKRIAAMLMSMKDPPEEINYLHWGVEGHDPDLPSGYDTRDFLCQIS